MSVEEEFSRLHDKIDSLNERIVDLEDQLHSTKEENKKLREELSIKIIKSNKDES